MLRITGGKVYDPANGIDGVVKDICIDGRPDRRRRVDRAAARSTRRGMIVFPGGVDVHTHVAGGALNFARGHDARKPARRPQVHPHAGAPRAASAA